MNTQLRRIALVLSAVAATFALGAFAPADELRQINLSVTVPFSFRVGDQRLPSGSYEVRRFIAARRDALVIRTMDRKAQATFLTNLTLKPDRFDGTALVFRRYGDQYFLHEVRVGSYAEVYKLPTSESERMIESEVASTRHYEQREPAVATVTIRAR